MAAEVDSLPPSPPLLPSERELEAMSTCQVDVRLPLEAGQAGSQQLVGLGEMAQGGLGEVSIKMLMSSKVSGGGVGLDMNRYWQG